MTQTMNSRHNQFADTPTLLGEAIPHFVMYYAVSLPGWRVHNG
jgi:hypothetical protein